MKKPFYKIFSAENRINNSIVRAHTRTTKSGNVVQVQQYQDSRTKKMQMQPPPQQPAAPPEPKPGGQMRYDKASSWKEVAAIGRKEGHTKAANAISKWSMKYPEDNPVSATADPGSIIWQTRSGAAYYMESTPDHNGEFIPHRTEPPDLKYAHGKEGADEASKYERSLNTPGRLKG